MLQYNPHLVELALKSIVLRSIDYIYANKFSFVSSTKDSYAGVEDDDVFTDIDIGAQTIYLTYLQQYFPGFGVLGEEDLHVNPDSKIWFTVDPIDGTKAYMRMQSTGVSTMIAMIVDNDVIAAYVGDINTGEIYGYGPVDTKVWRYTRECKGQVSLSDVKLKAKPSDAYIISLIKESSTSNEGKALVPQFKDLLVQNSSIGIIFAQLWSGIVGAVLLGKHYDTPWDSNPIIGISKQLGYCFYKYCDSSKSWIDLNVQVVRENKKIDYEVLITHPNLLAQLQS